MAAAHTRLKSHEPGALLCCDRRCRGGAGFELVEGALLSTGSLFAGGHPAPLAIVGGRGSAWLDFGPGIRVVGALTSGLESELEGPIILGPQLLYCKSPNRMSSLPSSELQELKREIRELTERVSFLERAASSPSRTEGSPSTVVPVTINYLQQQADSADSALPVGSAYPSQQPEVPTVSQSGRPKAGDYSDAFRRQVAEGVGEFFRRSLEGTNRGPSG